MSLLGIPKISSNSLRYWSSIQIQAHLKKILKIESNLCSFKKAKVQWNFSEKNVKLSSNSSAIKKNSSLNEVRSLKNTKVEFKFKFTSK